MLAKDTRRLMIVCVVTVLYKETKMKTKAFCAIVGLLFLAACGPIIGGMMVAGTGVKEVTVVQGDLGDLRPGSQVVVLGPFDKAPEGFYICRGEEAANFANTFNEAGLFKAELSLSTRFPDQPPKASDWQGQTPASVQANLNLNRQPEMVIGGTILKREMVAAPTQGVIMSVVYQLDFLNLTNGKMTSVQVVVKELFQNAIPETVNELSHLINAR
jgi:hypothetical protein